MEVALLDKYFQEESYMFLVFKLYTIRKCYPILHVYILIRENNE